MAEFLFDAEIKKADGTGKEQRMQHRTTKDVCGQRTAAFNPTVLCKK